MPAQVGLGQQALAALVRERRLAHVTEREHVLRDRRLNDGVTQIRRPAHVVVDKARGTREAAVIQEVVEREAKGVATFRETPVGRTDELKAPRQRILEASMEQQGGRAAEKHLERAARPPICIPQRLHHVGPVGNLLNLVNHQ